MTFQKVSLSSTSKLEMISFILNLPYTLIGLIEALISIPTSFKLHRKPFAFIFKVKSLWFQRFLSGRKTRALNIGNVILLSPDVEKNDFEHELIHVRQYNKLPFIFPLFYYLETFKHGYRKNHFEDEAYKLSGSICHGK